MVVADGHHSSSLLKFSRKQASSLSPSSRNTLTRLLLLFSQNSSFGDLKPQTYWELPARSHRLPEIPGGKRGKGAGDARAKGVPGAVPGAEGGRW